MLEASTQEASVTSQVGDHCENEEAPKVSSANPMPSSSKHIAVQRFSKRCQLFKFLLMWVCKSKKPIFFNRSPRITMLWYGCILGAKKQKLCKYKDIYKDILVLIFTQFLFP